MRWFDGSHQFEFVEVLLFSTGVEFQVCQRSEPIKVISDAKCEKGCEWDEWKLLSYFLVQLHAFHIFHVLDPAFVKNISQIPLFIHSDRQKRNKQ